MLYAFVLGRNPLLSVAELGSFFGAKVRVPNHKAVAFYEGVLPMEAQAFLNQLGGTTEIIEIAETGVPLGKAHERAFALLQKQCEKNSGKCLFGLNLVPERHDSRTQKLLLPALKKELRAAGLRANFLNKNFANVSGVAAMKQGLAKDGTLVSVVEEGEGTLALGFSVALQDVDAYSKRDYGKPFRDAQVGMLPPKLAQIMINVAIGKDATGAEATDVTKDGAGKKPAELTIVDPFCGTGTILVEALLIGHSVSGYDRVARLVEGSKKNIDWARQAFRLPESLKAEVATRDVTKEFSAPKSAVAVVTEPYLGPPLSAFPARQFLDKLTAELSALYLQTFQNMAKVLPTGSPVVMVFPYWRSRAETVRLSDGLIEKIKRLGYSVSAFVPSQQTSLLYDRPDQIVGREIIRFVKE